MRMMSPGCSLSDRPEASVFTVSEMATLPEGMSLSTTSEETGTVLTLLVRIAKSRRGAYSKGKGNVSFIQNIGRDCDAFDRAFMLKSSKVQNAKIELSLLR